MTLDDYTTLGRSGLRVSPLCLGTMIFSETPGLATATEDDARQIFNAYVDQGGNFIDTANIYTAGSSERLVGKFTQERGLRDRLVIATKFVMNTDATDPNAGGGGRKSMHRAVDASLKRLQTDYIDLYWMHAWDGITPAQEVLDGLNDLVRQGKIRHYGLSDTPAWFAAQVHTLAEREGKARPIALQLEYNLLERSIEREHIPASQELGMGLVTWGPLASGLLTGKLTRESAEGRTAIIQSHPGFTNIYNEKTFSVIDLLLVEAEKLGITPAQAAISWLVGRPGVTAPILGARTLPQFQENLTALDIALPSEARRKLDEISAPRLVHPYIFQQPPRNHVIIGETKVSAWIPQKL